MRIAVGAFHLKYAITELQDRNVKGAAAKVIDGNFLVLFAALIETVCKSSSGRLVNDSFYFQTGDLTGVFCCLTLTVIKVGRYRDHGFCNFVAEKCFSVSL